VIESESPDSGTDRLVIALKDPYHLFTRVQVAYLMGAAARWGEDTAAFDLAYAYELGRKSALREVSELNLAAIEAAGATATLSAAGTESDITRRARREAAEAAARLPREGDFPGWGHDESAHATAAEAVLASWGIDEVTA
jgi:hypothetical protein